MNITKWMGVCACSLLVLAATGWAYDVGPKNSTDSTPVPDVDKLGVGPLQGPSHGNDNGCWAATAANVLAGAGWGVGANAQARADNIYNDFVQTFGSSDPNDPNQMYIQLGGNCGAAAKWWVHNVGLNSAKEGAGYTPDCNYVNFRTIDRTLSSTDYSFLLNELTRCQYVSVFWLIPGQDLGHGMTLVGGNTYGTLDASGEVSIWHNSDWDPAVGDDEVYTNAWRSAPPNECTWFLDYHGTPGNQNDDWIAEGAFLDCPGKPKPVNAIDTFDVHYYYGITNTVDPNYPQAYVSKVQMLATGEKYGTYDAPDLRVGSGQTTEPYWVTEDPNDPNYRTLIVPNEVVENQNKVLWLSVDYNTPIGLDPNQTPPPVVVFDDADTEITLDSYEWQLDPNGKGEQVLMKYVFSDQPDWERVVFPGDPFRTLSGNILEWNIATECIPEPATLSLLALGAVALLRRRGN